MARPTLHFRFLIERTEETTRRGDGFGGGGGGGGGCAPFLIVFRRRDAHRNVQSIFRPGVPQKVRHSPRLPKEERDYRGMNGTWYSIEFVL